MASVTGSEVAKSEVPDMSEGDQEDVPPEPAPSFPPYPPYAIKPAPPSLGDTITAGHDLRLKHKSARKKSMRSPPSPAQPRGPKVTDVKMEKQQARAYARCLRKHGAVLTDRLERMAKPRKRDIIYLWREYAYTLPPETIARLSNMLDADEPFKPDQAYEYFANEQKSKKKTSASQARKARVKEIKKDVLAMSENKRFVWARNATVAFAKGVQQRLSRPGRYALADEMLNLSNIILEEICGYMHMRPPSRRSTLPKARFMMDISDKIAVWIDDILSEADDRMLMMDFDEDEEVEKSHADGLKPTVDESATPNVDTGGTTTPTSTGTTAEPPAGTIPKSEPVSPNKTPGGTPVSKSPVPTPTGTVTANPTAPASPAAINSPKPSESEVPKK